MNALPFFKSVTSDKGNLLERLLKLLHDNSIRYCVIGGVAVSAYTEPLFGLDFDFVVTSYQLGRFESLLAHTFLVKRSPRRIEITMTNSRVRANVHTDSRLAEFIERAQVRPVLDMELPVARLEDVLQAQVWQVDEPGRKPSQRLADLTQIARILETNPRLRDRVPDRILQQIQ